MGGPGSRSCSYSEQSLGMRYLGQGVFVLVKFSTMETGWALGTSVVLGAL